MDDIRAFGIIFDEDKVIHLEWQTVVESFAAFVCKLQNEIVINAKIIQLFP